MPRTPTDLAPHLTAAKIRGVHVGVRETLAHGFQRRVKVAWCNALAGRPGDICGRNRPVMVPSVVAAGWLIPASAKEYHDRTGDLVRCGCYFPKACSPTKHQNFRPLACRRFALVPTLAKEILQNCCAFLLENAGSNLALMIERRQLQ